MEWFKHKTSAHSDPVVSDAWDEFGDAGYVIWFVLLEIYGANYNSSNPDKELCLSKTFLRRKLRKSWVKVEQVLRFYEGFAKLSFKIDKKMVSIHIPKFTEILSNWSRRQTSTPTEAPTEAPTAKTRVREDKENITNTSAEVEAGFYKTKKGKKMMGKRLETFLLFWDTFNYKFGKAEAADVWYEIPELTNSLVSKIIKRAKYENDRRTGLISAGRTPKYAQGWLSGRRWEDEVQQNGSRVETQEERLLKQWKQTRGNNG